MDRRRRAEGGQGTSRPAMGVAARQPLRQPPVDRPVRAGRRAAARLHRRPRAARGGRRRDRPRAPAPRAQMAQRSSPRRRQDSPASCSKDIGPAAVGFAVVIGFGVNVAAAPSDAAYPATAPAAPPSAAPGGGVVRAPCRAAWPSASKPGAVHARTTPARRSAPFAQHGLARAAGLGETVTVRLPSGARSGSFQGLDEAGRLRLAHVGGSGTDRRRRSLLPRLAGSRRPGALRGLREADGASETSLSSFRLAVSARSA